MQVHFKTVFKLTACVLLLAITACKTIYYNKPDEITPKIQISEGGGFTGALSIYELLPNGQVFFRDMGDTTFQEVNRMSKKEAKKLFDLVREKLVNGETINEPDNIYRSISYITIEGTLTSVWYRNRSELDEVYSTILTRINSQNVVQ